MLKSHVQIQKSPLYPTSKQPCTRQTMYLTNQHIQNAISAARSASSSRANFDFFVFLYFFLRVTCYVSVLSVLLCLVVKVIFRLVVKIITYNTGFSFRLQGYFNFWFKALWNLFKHFLNAFISFGFRVDQ